MVFLGLVLLVFTDGGKGLLFGLLGVADTWMLDTRLRKPKVYEPVAYRLAMYCQSDQSHFPEVLSHAWLPKDLARVHLAWSCVSTNEASVQIGGGFYYYLYRLRLDQAASNPTTNVWRLWYYPDRSTNGTLLSTVALASSRRYSSAEVEKLVASYFDAEIEAGDTEAYKGKLMLKLRFSRTAEAAKVCEEWGKREPDFWLPQFALAHVRCRLGEAEPASRDFHQWVQSHKHFIHGICLALFEFREGRTNEAVAGLRIALEQPCAGRGADHGVGYDGALIAYVAGEYDLTLSLCDKLLSGQEPDRWRKPKLLGLKAAVMLLKDDAASAKELLKQAEASLDEDTDADSIQAGRRLRWLIESRDCAALKNLALWVDPSEKWYNPFETDESEIHNAGTLPTPYPKSWTTDYVNPKSAER